MNNRCFFVTDLHGHKARYQSLWQTVAEEQPGLVLLGGDMLPPPIKDSGSLFVQSELVPALISLRDLLKDNYPLIGLIPGNDDPKSVEPVFLSLEKQGLLHYLQERAFPWRGWTIIGFSYIPPTPFLLKDWERYDISRYAPPGAIPPENGIFSIDTDREAIPWETLRDRLKTLWGPLHNSPVIFLAHAPPYDTPLDIIDVHGKTIDHAPIDAHIGSLAIREAIETFQPVISLHGHAHESAQLSGQWMFQIGQSLAINGAHDGPELSLVRFKLDLDTNSITRELISPLIST